MKQIIFLLAITFLFSSCKKDKEPMQSISKQDIEKLNVYNPEKGKLEELFTTFKAEKEAYKNNMNNKTLINYDDRPVDLAIFQMEAVLNYEYGNITEEGVRLEKIDSLPFTVAVDHINQNGEIVIDGNDLMVKYAEIESYISINSNDKLHIYSDITLSKVENGIASFTCYKGIGIKPAYYTPVLSNFVFPSSQHDVLALDDNLWSDGTITPKGYKLINDNLWFSFNHDIHCHGGCSPIFYNFNNPVEHYIYGGGFVNDPVLGYGTAANLGLIWYREQHGCWPNSVLDYNQLNQYLNGARMLYTRWLANAPWSNQIITRWKVDIGERWHIAIDDSYHMGMRIDYGYAFYYCPSNCGTE